jgi:hypothetical protein
MKSCKNVLICLSVSVSFAYTYTRIQLPPYGFWWNLILETYWSRYTFFILIKWENDTLNEDFCIFLCMSWTLSLSLLFLFCRFFFIWSHKNCIYYYVKFDTSFGLYMWYDILTRLLYMLHILYISYLNHIIHSMTCYTSIIQRMYRIVNSNLYAIVWLPYLWRLQCIFLFNNIVYIFIMICKQYCWHSSTYLFQSAILFTRALFDRMIFVFCCKTCA